MPEKPTHVTGDATTFTCPMHEEPLRLIPPEWRERVLTDLGLNAAGKPQVHIDGDLDPACRLIFRELHDEVRRRLGAGRCEHIRVQRLILSEKDRVGIGTFQPKDEKNQDSTELTGDINYRKIAEYGSDSRSARASTSTASSTSPTAASSSSSRC